MTEIVRLLVVLVAFAAIAWLYRSLPQNLNALARRYARLSPSFRAAQRDRLERELAAYQAMLTDPPAFQAEALHRQALIVVSGTMTLLALLLFVASRVAQPGIGAALAPYFPSVDALLILFFVFSLVGFRLAVFRSWIFLHKERNLGRLRGTITALGAQNRE